MVAAVVSQTQAGDGADAQGEQPPTAEAFESAAKFWRRTLVLHLLLLLRITGKFIGVLVPVLLAVAVGIHESTVLRLGYGVQIPESLHGWNVLITGSTSGTGFEAAKLLVRRGAQVIVHGPNFNRTQNSAARVRKVASNGGKVVPIAADLTDFGAVRRLAGQAKKLGKMHLLILNAAFQYSGGPHDMDAVKRQGLTKKDYVGVSGHDKVMAANHLGHFLLTQLVAPFLAKGAIIVIVYSCSSWHTGTYDRLLKGAGPDRLRWELRPRYPYLAYWDSKLANVCFSRALRKRIGHRATVILHDPGLMHTALAMARETNPNQTWKRHRVSRKNFETRQYEQRHLMKEHDTWVEWKYSTEDAGKHLVHATFVTRRPVPDSVNPFFMPGLFVGWLAKPDMVRYRDLHGYWTYSWVKYARYSYGNMYASIAPECGEDFEDRHWRWSAQQVGLASTDPPL